LVTREYTGNNREKQTAVGSQPIHPKHETPMSLFKRKDPQAESLRVIVQWPTWADRLGGIGVALDGVDHAMRDVVAVTDGGPGDSGASINMLGHRQSAFHSIWAPIMYEWEQGEEQLIDYVSGAAVVTRPSSSANADPDGSWASRFRAIGSLLDRKGAVLRSVTVIDLEDGAVVNALVRASDFSATLTLRSFEFSNLQIRSLAPAPATDAYARSIAR
jgi:hypothetical protein